MPKVNFYDKKLEVISEGRLIAKHEFQWPIKQVIEFLKSYVIRLEPDLGTIDNRNVYGINYNGEVIWRIENGTFVYKDSPFTGMSKLGDKVKLLNWDGSDWIVDPETGEVIERSFSK